MTLKIQIISLIVSFLYGIFFSFLLNINYKIIYNNNKFIKIFGTFLFIVFNSLLYFLILLKVNNGIVHIYCILSLICGFIFHTSFLYKRIRMIAFKHKKLYNH